MFENPFSGSTSYLQKSENKRLEEQVSATPGHVGSSEFFVYPKAEILCKTLIRPAAAQRRTFP
jgi:hypothetical protein